jgi:hypothetical protein
MTAIGFGLPLGEPEETLDHSGISESQRVASETVTGFI